MANVMQWFAWP